MASQVELVRAHLTGASSMNLQGLSLGIMDSHTHNIPILDMAVSIPNELCPSHALCAMVGGHTMKAQEHAQGWWVCWQKSFPACKSYI